MAQARKKLDFRALAEALTDPATAPADMAAVAGRLGIAKPTLYRMAGSRSELISLSLDAEAERLLDAIHHDALDGFFAFAEADPAGFQLLFGGRYPQARPVVGRIARRVDELVPGAGHGVVALAAAVVLADPGARAERMRSDFDELAKTLAAISDSGAVGAP